MVMLMVMVMALRLPQVLYSSPKPQWLNLAPQAKYQICWAPEPFDTLVTGLGDGDGDGDSDGDGDGDSTRFFIHSYYTRTSLSRQPMESVFVMKFANHVKPLPFPIIAKPPRKFINTCIWKLIFFFLTDLLRCDKKKKILVYIRSVVHIRGANNSSNAYKKWKQNNIN